MYKEAIRPAWAEINLTNLEHNIDKIMEKIGKERALIGVIKADAYGHGAVESAKVLESKGVKRLAVATLQEGVTLREAGIKSQIVILGLTPDLFADTLVDFDLTPVLCSLDNAIAIDSACREKGKQLSCFIAVDTGMGRIGYQPSDIQIAVDEVAKINQLSNLKVEALFSHMSTADAKDKTYSMTQKENFDTFYEKLSEAGINIPYRTLANSASIMEIPTVHYELIRPGIILYGLYPSNEVDKKEIDLKPVMSVKATIVHLKEIPTGAFVGYGRSFTAERPSKIATITLGYADGYPRPFSKSAKVIVGDKLCKVAGNICMDQTMIDVTDAADVKVGDQVIIMGEKDGLSITADDIAEATATINYEIVCAFGQRLPKVFVR